MNSLLACGIDLVQPLSGLRTILLDSSRPITNSSRQWQVSLAPAAAGPVPSDRPALLGRVWPPLLSASRYERSAPRRAPAEALRSPAFSQAIAKILRAYFRIPYSGRRSSPAPALRKSPPALACAQIC